MKKEDIKYVVIFILLIIGIGILFIYNLNSNKKNDVDRKVKYIFNNLTYDNVYQKSKELFLDSIKLINYDFIYETKDNNVVLYGMDGRSGLKKIVNTSVLNSLSNSELKKYIKDNNIIDKDNHYYIGEAKTKNSHYVGSSLEIEKYDNKSVTLSVVNYYKKNTQYIGIIDDKLDDSYSTTNTTFTVLLENNRLVINNLDEIKKIY